MTASMQKRVALVTGAAQGVGRATVERLTAHGWYVVAADIDDQRLNWAAGRDDVATCVADISTEDGNAAMVEIAEQRFGGLNAAILNAGISISGPIDTLEMSDFDKLIAVNLRGVVLGIRASLPALRKVENGAIAVTASGYALGGDPGFWAYAATKHAVVGVVKSVAREIGAEGIRINAACPSAIIGTGLSGPVKETAPAVHEAIAQAIPMQRWCEPDEVAAVLEFLVSDGSTFVSGTAIPVDGGALSGVGLLGPGTSSSQF